MECRAEDGGAAYARSRAYAEQAGDLALANEMSSQLPGVVVLGPTTVESALAASERWIADAADKPLMQARAKRALARLLACVGEFERARLLAAESLETIRQAGLTIAASAGVQASGFVEHLAGDDEAAVEVLREGADELRRLGDHRFFSTTALSLVQSLLELGRIDEAEQWLREATADANPADVIDAAAIEAARGHIAALRGHHALANEHAEAAVEMAERTDYFELRTTMHLEHAKVLRLAGRRDDAAAAYERARAVTRAKGATAWTKQIEERLAEL
jgi:tetratricopeptide (TPR) repeat protein